VERAVAAGVDRVQIRDRSLEGRDLLAHARRVAEAARRGARSRRAERAVEVVVNRRVDVAMTIGADGVHLGFDALDVAAARRLCEAHGGPRLLGVSAHSETEVEAAAQAGADYAHLAPIHPPISKAASRPCLGLETLARACAHGISVIAQGGITAERAGEAIAAGAAGVAVSGSILLADDPETAAAELRRALDRARAGPAG
jgi:thiamine-phosphate pyrophosphorylase